MLLEKILKQSLLGLSALLINCGSENGQEGAGCTSDQECKGNRICIQGQCVTPENYENDSTPDETNSSPVCEPNCGYPCDDSCTSLVHEDFDEEDCYVWSSCPYAEALVSGGNLEMYPNRTNVYFENYSLHHSYKLGNFNKFVFKFRAKNEGAAFGITILGRSPTGEFNAGHFGCFSVIRYDKDLDELVYNPSYFYCSSDSSEGETQFEDYSLNSDQLHHFKINWYKDGSAELFVDGGLRGNISTTALDTEEYTYEVHLKCYENSSSPKSGICLFDYFYWSRE